MQGLPEGWDRSAFWLEAIREARTEPDAVLANLRITQLHYRLSLALARVLSREAGPNFHTWAVWGSRKAGVTIRQEGRDTPDALRTDSEVERRAGVVGMRDQGSVLQQRKPRW